VTQRSVSLLLSSRFSAVDGYTAAAAVSLAVGLSRSLSKLSVHMGNSTITNAQILFLGLDNSGKSTIIQVCKNDFTPTPEDDQIKPTVGHSVTHFKGKEKAFQLAAWDLSGKDQFRSLWKSYYKHANAICFVVDSAEDEERMEEVKEVLHGVLQDVELRDAILLICANKMDLPSAKSAQNMTDILGLTSTTTGLSKRAWKLQPTCAKTGDGLREGFEWLSAQLKTKLKTKK
jgi:ADP-ribosylation factor protein 1